MMDFAEMQFTARNIIERLQENGFTAEGQDWRQVLCVVEEAGEFAAAWRRYSGNARRGGTFEEMAAELADVMITVFVAAEMLKIDLDYEIRTKLRTIYMRGWREESK